MSLNLNPGFLPPMTTPVAHPARTTPSQPVPAEPTGEQPAAGRATKRSDDYVAALRELREEQQSSRQTQATRTYLQIAHYEGDFQLVDVYT